MNIATKPSDFQIPDSFLELMNLKGCFDSMIELAREEAAKRACSNSEYLAKLGNGGSISDSGILEIKKEKVLILIDAMCPDNWVVLTKSDRLFSNDITSLQYGTDGKTLYLLGHKTCQTEEQLLASIYENTRNKLAEFVKKKKAIKQRVLQPKDCGQVTWFHYDGNYYQGNVIGIRGQERLVILKGTAITATTVVALCNGSIKEAFFLQPCHDLTKEGRPPTSNVYRATNIIEHIQQYTSSNEEIHWTITNELIEYLDQPY